MRFTLKTKTLKEQEVEYRQHLEEQISVAIKNEDYRVASLLEMGLIYYNKMTQY